MRRLMGIGLLAGGLWLGVLGTGPVEACPSCKAANNTDPSLPQAFQLSILFMLSVPAIMATSLGVVLYRLNKQQEQAVAEFENGDVWVGPTPAGEAGEG